MLQSIYDQMMDFIEILKKSMVCSLVIILTGNMFILSFDLLSCPISYYESSDFSVYHYRVAYRLYLEKLIMKQGLLLVEII